MRRRSAKPFTTNQPSLTQDLMALHDELRLYDPELVKKPSVVFINKSDLLSGWNFVYTIQDYSVFEISLRRIISFFE